MNNLQMWSLVVGFVLPPLIALIKNESWSTSAKAILTFVISLVAAIGTVFIQQDGHFAVDNWIGSALTILVAAIATYHGFWKPTVTARE